MDGMILGQLRFEGAAQVVEQPAPPFHPGIADNAEEMRPQVLLGVTVEIDDVDAPFRGRIEGIGNSDVSRQPFRASNDLFRQQVHKFFEPLKSASLHREPAHIHNQRDGVGVASIPRCRHRVRSLHLSRLAPRHALDEVDMRRARLHATRCQYLDDFRSFGLGLLD
jgi:hypothetical protein